MKKHFFIITLLALVVLGFGNYTSGQFSPCGQAPNPTTASQSEIDIYNACIAAQSPSPSNSTSCETNAHKNLANICVCNTGYKSGTPPCKKCSDPGVCCGIQLNTSIPFIGNCIENQESDVGAGEEKSVTGTTAFPVLMGSLTKILVTVILIVSFILIIIGGIMIATGNPSGGRKMIINVVIGIALLGASGVILRLINPNFFG